MRRAAWTDGLAPFRGVAAGVSLGAVLWTALILVWRLLAPWQP